MSNVPNHRFSLFLLLLTLVSFSQLSRAALVENIEQFNKAAASVSPGDEIVLANGTWNDVELVLKGKGQADNPITLKAQTPGKVIITGQSNLAFSGEYIVISGLVFKDGSTPTGEVISFRTSNDDVANHSRVTNTVIDNFSTDLRQMSDLWVAMYGKHNRFDTTRSSISVIAV